jgi:hypothetical protein
LGWSAGRHQGAGHGRHHPGDAEAEVVHDCHQAVAE